MQQTEARKFVSNIKHNLLNVTSMKKEYLANQYLQRAYGVAKAVNEIDDNVNLDRFIQDFKNHKHATTLIKDLNPQVFIKQNN